MNMSSCPFSSLFFSSQPQVLAIFYMPGFLSFFTLPWLFLIHSALKEETILNLNHLVEILHHPILFSPSSPVLSYRLQLLLPTYLKLGRVACHEQNLMYIYKMFQHFVVLYPLSTLWAGVALNSLSVCFWSCISNCKFTGILWKKIYFRLLQYQKVIFNSNSHSHNIYINYIFHNIAHCKYSQAKNLRKAVGTNPSTSCSSEINLPSTLLTLIQPSWSPSVT